MEIPSIYMVDGFYNFRGYKRINNIADIKKTLDNNPFFSLSLL